MKQKRKLPCVLLTVSLALSLSACGSSSSESPTTGNDIAPAQQATIQQVDEQADQSPYDEHFYDNQDNEITTMTFKEAVAEHQIWFYGKRAVAKDKQPEIVIVFENSNATIYKIEDYAGLAFGEMVNMTDDEIVSFYESTCSSENVFHYNNYDFTITTDDSGNKTIGEVVILHDQNEEAKNYKTSFPEGGTINSISSQQIYDAFYIGFFSAHANSDSKYPHYFITKCATDTVFTYDQPGTPGVTEE